MLPKGGKKFVYFDLKESSPSYGCPVVLITHDDSGKEVEYYCFDKFKNPANLTDAQVREVQRLAIAAFRAVDCAGMARVDSFIDASSGKIYVNEVNTIPGFTTISMYPKMWEASGVSYSELIDRLITLALERHAEKQQLRTSVT